MPFDLVELLNARKAYHEFLSRNPPKDHARYIFPFFAGSYFAYRKVDVLRTVAVAHSLSDTPKYVDFGCGYGDYLGRIRNYLPAAIGVEAQAGIFYAMQISRTEFILPVSVESFRDNVDLAFVGWMEPGQDFRAQVAKRAKCIITTFDLGGQCGVNGGCEYDEFGYKLVASWRTPSWIDVNSELMNRYYTPGLSKEQKKRLETLRSAHNIWHVYSKEENFHKIREALTIQIDKERKSIANERYDFESVLDECGFGFMQEIQGVTTDKKLWQVRFH